jgi:hypothetical protein
VLDKLKKERKIIFMNKNVRLLIAKAARKLARAIRRGTVDLGTDSFVQYTSDYSNYGPRCAGGFIAAAAGFDPKETEEVFETARVGLKRIINHNDRGNKKLLLKRLDEIKTRFLQ